MKIKIELSEVLKDRVVITTQGGQKFEVIVKDDTIEVFASTHFGSNLVVRPGANNKVIISQD